jgi:hypothetical protein
MTVRFQISDKRGDAILLATAEGDDPIAVEQDFAEAVAVAGLAASYEAFSQPAPAYQQPASLGQARANVVQAFNNPPTPPLPAAADGGAPPSCQHGTKVYKSGEKNGRQWEAWACPGRSSDPTRCGFEWIR